MVLNAQRMYISTAILRCKRNRTPVSCRGLGLSDFVVEGSQAGEIQAGSLQALAYAAGELHAREHLQQVASVASVAVRALGTQPHPCQGCVRGMMGYPPQRPRGQLAEVSTWPNQRSLSSV